MPHEAYPNNPNAYPEPHPDDPNQGTPEEDKFYNHSVTNKEQHDTQTPRGADAAARPGSIGPGQAEMPTDATGQSGENIRPHNQSSDLKNLQNGDHTDGNERQTLRR